MGMYVGVVVGMYVGVYVGVFVGVYVCVYAGVYVGVVGVGVGVVVGVYVGVVVGVYIGVVVGVVVIIQELPVIIRIALLSESAVSLFCAFSTATEVDVFNRANVAAKLSPEYSPRLPAIPATVVIIPVLLVTIRITLLLRSAK